MNTAFAIALKDVRLLLRDRVAAVFTFVFPLLIAVFFGLVFGGGGQQSDMTIAVVDEDGGPAAAAFRADLAKAAGIKVVEAADRAAGERLVRKDDAVASVVIPKGFQEASENLFAGESMRIEGVVSPSNAAASGLLTGKLTQLGYSQVIGAFGDRDRMLGMVSKARAAVNESKELPAVRRLLLNTLFGSIDSLFAPSAGGAPGDAGGTGAGGLGLPGGFEPVKVELKALPSRKDAPQSSFAVSFPQGIVWGLMGCVTAFGASLASERAQGTLMRLTAAPISRSRVLVGKALACFITSVVVQVFMIAVGMVAFGVVVQSWAVLVAAVVLSAFGFVGVMMLIAGFAQSEGAAGGMGRALVLVLAMIGGGSIPLEFMPPVMQTVSNVSPFKWSTLAIQGGLWRAWSLADLAVPGGVLLAMGVVGFAAGMGAFKRWHAA